MLTLIAAASLAAPPTDVEETRRIRATFGPAVTIFDREWTKEIDDASTLEGYGGATVRVGYRTGLYTVIHGEVGAQVGISSRVLTGFGLDVLPFKTDVLYVGPRLNAHTGAFAGPAFGVGAAVGTGWVSKGGFALQVGLGGGVRAWEEGVAPVVLGDLRIGFAL